MFCTVMWLERLISIVQMSDDLQRSAWIVFHSEKMEINDSFSFSFEILHRSSFTTQQWLVYSYLLLTQSAIYFFFAFPYKKMQIMWPYMEYT